MIELYPKIFLIEGFCSSYYIDDKIKVLIDAGSDFTGKVDILVITHIHPDHVFYISSIQKRTGCKVFIGKDDEDVGKFLFHVPGWQGKKIEKFGIDKVLVKDDVINTGSYNLEVLPTPGHTLGSISLYEKKHEILFSGDTIFKNGLIGRTDFLHSSEELMQKTLKMIGKLKIKHLFSGHDE